jgi:glyoxylase-like metal-dependent hydrolase (beta-lactamase superfamily II)
MKVHHLNCGTMCPLAGRWVEGHGSPFSRGNLVCHCLLVETNSGLVLVETGLGRQDLLQPRHRLGLGFVGFTLPRLDPAETAVAQIERLGFAARDVRHIILTHGHCDHAGGIADFPDATVHLSAHEYDAISAPRTRHERNVYRRVQWSHGPRWAPHATDGETWNGFAAVRAVPGLEPEFLLLPLPGHTRGHAAVVVQDADRVIVHAGDLYMHRDQLHAANATPPLALRVFHRLIDLDTELRRQNLDRLRALQQQRSSFEVFCAHDPVEFQRYSAAR